MYMKYYNECLGQTSYWSLTSDGLHNLISGRSIGWDQFATDCNTRRMLYPQHMTILTKDELFLEMI